MSETIETKNPEGDLLLRSLIMLAEEIPETAKVLVALFVKGTIIQGTIIGQIEYMRMLLAQISSKESDVSDKPFRIESIDRFIESSRPIPGDPPTYIHLGEASIYNVARGSFLPIDGTPWRGAISSVDGFLFLNRFVEAE